MTDAGLVITACTMLGIREPIEFYQLSEGAQTAWIEHAHNTVTGAYYARPSTKAGGRKPKAVSTAQWAAEAAQAARERGVLGGDTWQG